MYGPPMGGQPDPRMMAGLQMAGGMQNAMQQGQQSGRRPGAAMGQAMLDPQMMALMLQMRGGQRPAGIMGGMPGMGQPMGPGGLLGGRV